MAAPSALSKFRGVTALFLIFCFLKAEGISSAVMDIALLRPLAQ